MLKQLKKILPSRMKWAIKYITFSIEDLISLIKGGRKSLVPPKRKIFIGAGDFEEVGRSVVKFIIEHTQLQSDASVLDVGSGQGRIALPLTEFLSRDGRYCGLEIVNSAVIWCQEVYSQFPNFEFLHADVYNKYYNRNGRISAREYRFPFPDNSFDVIILTSVFTHMRSEDVQNYIGEIARCLKPGGKCVASYFLLSPDRIKKIALSQSKLTFKHRLDEFSMTTTPSNPEDAIALEESLVIRLYRESNLQQLGSIHYGTWCDQGSKALTQDLIVAEKTLDS